MTDPRSAFALSDDTVDRLVARLDRAPAPFPSPAFAAASRERLAPLIRDARRRDASLRGRLAQRLAASGNRIDGSAAGLRRRAVLLVALVVTVLLAIVAALVVGGPRNDQARVPPPSLPVATAQPSSPTASAIPSGPITTRAIFVNGAGAFVTGAEAGPARKLAALTASDAGIGEVASPDGSQIALTYPVSGGAGDATAIAVVAVRDGARRTVAEGRFTPGTLSWSPDGTRLAIGQNASPPDASGVTALDGAIIEVRSGRVTRLPGRWAALAIGVPREPPFAWSPDGRHVAALASRSCAAPSDGSEPSFDLVVIDVETSATQRIGQGFSVVQAPVWAPDGRRLAFLAQSDCAGVNTLVDQNVTGGTLAVGDAATGNAISLNTLPIADNVQWLPDGDRLLFSAPCSSDNASPYCIFAVAADGTGQGRPPDAPNVDIPAGDAWPVVTATDGYVSPILAPDGLSMLYFTYCGPPTCEGFHGPHDLRVGSVDGRTARDLGTVEAEIRPIWSADSGRIVVARADQTGVSIWAFRPDGSDPRELDSNVGDLIQLELGPS